MCVPDACIYKSFQCLLQGVGGGSGFAYTWIVGRFIILRAWGAEHDDSSGVWFAG